MNKYRKQDVIWNKHDTTFKRHYLKCETTLKCEQDKYEIKLLLTFKIWIIIKYDIFKIWDTFKYKKKRTNNYETHII